MTRLRHPHIYPPLVIEVEDARVPAHTSAGWLPFEEPNPHTTEPHGADDTTPEEETDE